MEKEEHKTKENKSLKQARKSSSKKSAPQKNKEKPLKQPLTKKAPVTLTDKDKSSPLFLGRLQEKPLEKEQMNESQASRDKNKRSHKRMLGSGERGKPSKKTTPSESSHRWMRQFFSGVSSPSASVLSPLSSNVQALHSSFDGVPKLTPEVKNKLEALQAVLGSDLAQWDEAEKWFRQNKPKNPRSLFLSSSLTSSPVPSLIGVSAPVFSPVTSTSSSSETTTLAGLRL